MPLPESALLLPVGSGVFSPSISAADLTGKKLENTDATPKRKSQARSHPLVIPA
jgi:hypothetical protein